MSRKYVFSLLLLLVVSMFSLPTGAAKKEKRSVVRLETSAGNIRIALSDLTPIHRDNFLTLVQQGYYDGLLFHRVIEDFMIQTGDPDSRNAPKDSLLGNGGPGYTLAAEIVFPDLFHLRGSVAAVREGDDVNPEFRSSGSQFYIVWGKTNNDSQLVQLSKQMEIQAQQQILNRLAAEHRSEIMNLRRNRDQAGLMELQNELDAEEHNQETLLERMLETEMELNELAEQGF